MGKRFEHTGREAIVTDTATGEQVIAKEVRVEDDAYGSKAVLAAVTGGIGLLGFAAGPDVSTKYETSDGRLIGGSDPVYRKP